MDEALKDVAVALDRTASLMRWRDAHEERHRMEDDALEERLHKHGKGIQEFVLFKAEHHEAQREQRTEDAVRDKRILEVEKKVDMISVKMLIIWSLGAAAVSTLFKYVFQLAVEGRLVH